MPGTKQLTHIHTLIVKASVAVMGSVMTCSTHLIVFRNMQIPFFPQSTIKNSNIFNLKYIKERTAANGPTADAETRVYLVVTWLNICGAP